MRKLLIIFYFMISLLLLSEDPAIALRCGNDLIREGDSTSEVGITLANNGGEIIEKEYIGTKGIGTISSKKKRRNASGRSTYDPVEKWFVRSPSGYGRPYCYELTFTGSILKEIGTAVECK